MGIDDFVKVMEALSKLIGVLAWPLLVCFILVKFGPALKDFFSSLGEFSLKGGGIEATAKRKKAEVTAALVAASVRPKDETSPEAAAIEASEAAKVVAESVTARVILKASLATALWVDDRPENNILERQSLETLGISIVPATSTDEALDQLARRKFNVVISDMARPEDSRAGYTLLDRMRASGDVTPFIIYSSSNAPKHKAEARLHGAVGCTNRASELFGYVLAALNR